MSESRRTASGRPEAREAEPYYWRYIDRVPGEDVLTVLEAQVREAAPLFARVSERKSLHRYAADKWSIRQVLNHVSDTERLALFRAFWFARGFSDPLPSFDQAVCAAGARADDVSWAEHVEEFRSVRAATLTFLRALPAEAWTRGGVASGCGFTVRSLAYVAAGHLDHHRALLEDRYL